MNTRKPYDQTCDFCGETRTNYSTHSLKPTTEFCQSCCEHWDADEYECLDCGKELTEERMCRAYDRMKSLKYGD